MINEKQIEIQANLNFPCPVYLVDIPDFLNVVNGVSEEYLKKQHEKRSVNEIYPVVMTDNYMDDFRLKDFSRYIGETSWNVLNDQGYDMEHLNVSFQSMWTQEHHKQSSMEQHVHGYGAQIVGFYFLEVPENSSSVIFHDPRPGKIMSDLPQKDVFSLTVASQMVNYRPKPGLMIFSNAWLPHSFTRNESEKPIKFVHFNVVAVPRHENVFQQPNVEVI